MKTFDIAGRVALVTGASSGFGEHFSRLLASGGATVIAAARRVDRLEKLVAEIGAAGGKAHAVALDVTDPASVAAAFAKIAAIGAPAIVVNNAGIGAGKPSLELSEDDWRATMSTNLDGAWRVAQASAKLMIATRQPGSIINIASILGLRVASGNLLAYAAAKAALVQVTKALAVEWARYDIRVNAIAPGYVETEMNRGLFATEAGQAMVKRIPQRRIGTLGDLDGALFLLASDASRYMTGTVIVVDGGHSTNAL